MVAALFVSLPLLASGNSFLGALLALRLSFQGTPDQTLGLILSLHSFGFVLGCQYASRIIYAVGHIRAFAGLAAISSSFTLLHPMLETPLVWAMLRLVLGFSTATMLTVIESWIAARATAQTRARLLAEYSVVFYLATAGGQFLIGRVELTGYFPFSLAAILLAWSLVPMALGRSHAPLPETGDSLSFQALYRIAPAAAIGVLAAGAAAGAFISLGPVYGLQIGLDASGISQFMGVSILAGMLSQPPVGWLSNRVGRQQTMLLVSALATIAAIASLFLAGHPALPWVAAVLFGALATIYPLAVAIANDRLEPALILPAAGTLLLGYGLGTCVGPIAGAQLMAWFGPLAWPGFIGGTCALMTLVAAWRWWRTRQEDQGSLNFVPAPAMVTPVLAEQAEIIAEHQAQDSDHTGVEAAQREAEKLSTESPVDYPDEKP